MSQKMPQGTAWLAVLAGLLFAMAQARAEDDPQAYKCVTRSGVTYSQVPCPGGKLVSMGAARHGAASHTPPPQDRAVIAKRATLSPEDRQECRELDGRLREQQAEVKAKGAAATLEDEMPLVQSRKKFRELRC
jgi:hypothetical protein